MSGHVSADPLRACVKVDDCCAHFLQVHRTLTCVKTIETIVESVLPLNMCDAQ
jgi:hypothetical protein